MSARDRILGRVRNTVLGRDRTAHPGAFAGSRPGQSGTPIVMFATLFEAAGGEIVRAQSIDDAAAWLSEFQLGYDAATTGTTVPEQLQPTLPPAPPDLAPLGVSMARGAIGETGSLVLDARDGRRSQLLPPTHVVFLRTDEVHATFRDALLAIAGDLPSAIGLHSGPSKSADIGQILVRGVHGPGRIVAVLVEGH